MRVLIFGSTGMLGRELLRSLSEEYEVIAPQRPDCDLANLEQIDQYIKDCAPHIVINSAAIVNIERCEQNKEHATKINASSVLKMALACNTIDAVFVQISTDHFYTKDGDKKHKEDHYLTIFNHYAYTKLIAESYAALAKKHLIIRTNIIGFKDLHSGTSFLDWVVRGVVKNVSMNLFEDYYASSIDIYNFTLILKKVLEKKLCGLYNIAAADVVSKADFIVKLSKKLGFSLNNPCFMNVENAYGKGLTQRATTNGLDTKKIERELNITMPNTDQILEKIYEVYHEKYEQI